jgi:hypothetical protein
MAALSLPVGEAEAARYVEAVSAFAAERAPLIASVSPRPASSP